ncbi:MAG: SDR family oxidoreductase [Streptosporangiaceae bacterium]
MRASVPTRPPSTRSRPHADGGEGDGRPGIRVNTVHTGPTDTDFQRAVEVSAAGAPADVVARIFETGIPLARHACPEEIARSVLYLASSDRPFVTDAALAVDGGMQI